MQYMVITIGLLLRHSIPYWVITWNRSEFRCYQTNLDKAYKVKRDTHHDLILHVACCHGNNLITACNCIVCSRMCGNFVNKKLLFCDFLLPKTILVEQIAWCHCLKLFAINNVDIADEYSLFKIACKRCFIQWILGRD